MKYGFCCVWSNEQDETDTPGWAGSEQPPLNPIVFMTPFSQSQWSCSLQVSLNDTQALDIK